MEIAGYKVSQKQQMMIARKCENALRMFYTPPLHDESCETIARTIRTVLADAGSNLGLLMKRATDMQSSGLTGSAITPEIVKTLSKFCK